MQRQVISLAEDLAGRRENDWVCSGCFRWNGWSLSRFGVQKLMPQSVLPVATLTVNILGSFLLGWIVGQGIQGALYLFTATGFMGAFTTFSTLNVDLVKLINSKEDKALVVYVVSTYVGGILSAAPG